MKITRLLIPILALAFAGGCATTPRSTPVPRNAAPGNSALDVAVLDQVPVPRYQTKPVYPPDLYKKGITGRAVIGFIVDAEGNVRDPWVMQETHEGFGVAAWQAVSQWKFRPGRKGGRNVNVRMAVPVIFQIEDDTPAAVMPKANAPRSAPPQGTALDLAVLDQIPVARHLAKPVYPPNLYQKGITGQAVIGFIVDLDGNVRDAWVIEETHKEFGEAAWQAVSQWKFKPGRKGGRNVNVRMKVPVIFNIEDGTPPPASLNSY